MNFSDFEYAFTSELGSSPSMENPTRKANLSVESSESWNDMMDPAVYELTDGADGLTLNPKQLENRLSRSLDYGHQSYVDLDNQPRSLEFQSTSSHETSPNKNRTDEPDSSDKIKYKLLSAWNNMRHGQ